MYKYQQNASLHKTMCRNTSVFKSERREEPTDTSKIYTKDNEQQLEKVEHEPVCTKRRRGHLTRVRPKEKTLWKASQHPACSNLRASYPQAMPTTIVGITGKL